MSQKWSLPAQPGPVGSGDRRAARQECESAFIGGAQKLHCDFLNFGSIVWHKYPTLFFTLRENWDEALSTAILNINVTVQIDRLGIEYGYEG